jgi:hypothetical protein
LAFIIAKQSTRRKAKIANKRRGTRRKSSGDTGNIEVLKSYT